MASRPNSGLQVGAVLSVIAVLLLGGIASERVTTVYEVEIACALGHPDDSGGSGEQEPHEERDCEDLEEDDDPFGPDPIESTVECRTSPALAGCGRDASMYGSEWIDELERPPRARA